MSGQETFTSNSSSLATVSSAALADHLGVSRNSVPAIAERFGIAKDGKGYRKLDVFRKIHGIEPVLLNRTLTALKAEHSIVFGKDQNDDENIEPESVCLIDELATVHDLAATFWDDGLVHVADFAGEYGYSYDRFRKKLKAKEIDLPLVPAILLSTNRKMYRRLEMLLWRRYRIALELPRTSKMASENAVPAASEDALAVAAAATPEAVTAALFGMAVAANGKKSGFEASPAQSPGALHEARP